jgi:hypothetical protein
VTGRLGQSTRVCRWLLPRARLSALIGDSPLASDRGSPNQSYG